MKREVKFICASWRKVFLLFMLLVFCDVIYAQKINVQLKNVTVAEALKKMSAVTDYEFFYNSKQLTECTKRVNANYQNIDLAEALRIFFPIQILLLRSKIVPLLSFLDRLLRNRCNLRKKR